MGIFVCLKTNNIMQQFDKDDLYFFGEKVIAWEQSGEPYDLQALVNNYIDRNKYPLPGQRENDLQEQIYRNEFFDKD